MPRRYLEEYLEFVGMTEDEFYETLDAFTNKAIFGPTRRPHRPRRQRGRREARVAGRRRGRRARRASRAGPVRRGDQRHGDARARR